MARQALVLDASIGVKWFSGKGEASLPQALDIRDKHVTGENHILVPELFLYEVANALVHKKHIPDGEVQRAVQSLFDLDLEALSEDATSIVASVEIAGRLDITVYDACYVALARRYGCPLVTANPRHQGRDLGCRVISIDDWPKQTL